MAAILKKLKFKMLETSVENSPVSSKIHHITMSNSVLNKDLDSIIELAQKSKVHLEQMILQKTKLEQQLKELSAQYSLLEKAKKEEDEKKVNLETELKRLQAESSRVSTEYTNKRIIDLENEKKILESEILKLKTTETKSQYLIIKPRMVACCNNVSPIPKRPVPNGNADIMFDESLSLPLSQFPGVIATITSKIMIDDVLTETKIPIIINGSNKNIAKKFDGILEINRGTLYHKRGEQTKPLEVTQSFVFQSPITVVLEPGRYGDFELKESMEAIM